MLHLQGYSEPVQMAVLAFIPVAILFALPFMIWQYRRYGSIPVLRILVVYSFMLYMICAFLLTVLPLPSAEKLETMQPAGVQLIPFQTYCKAFSDAGISISEPASMIESANWKKLFTSSNLFEICANIVMQIPLGVYLRYYFRRNLKQTVLIGFLVSLFYEFTQLTGLWFAFGKAYRLFSVDDLFDNTLGALIGFAAEPLLCAFLPSRERLDEISIARARRLTLIRRFTSAVTDWVIYSATLSLVIYLMPSDSGFAAKVMMISAPAYIIVVFVIGQRLFHGRTPGKVLLHIAVRDRQTDNVPRFRQLIIRYSLIYAVMPFTVLVSGMTGIAALMMALYSEGYGQRLAGIIGCALLVLVWAVSLTVILRKHRELPHSYLSHTYIANARNHK